MKKKSSQFLLLAILSSFVFLNACTVAYKSTGDILIGFAKDEGIPYMLATDDVSMACSMAQSFSPFLLSFSSVTESPEQLAVLFYLISGSCIEFKAWEQELRYLRAIYAKNPIEAQDARIAQQRYLVQATQRQLKGYQFLVSAVAEPGDECPELSSNDDELYWLIGLIDGVQALMNNIASGGSLPVPMDIAAKVSRGASCLNNEHWWGVPNAIQAAIWLTIPGSTPVDKEPEEVLQQSLQVALQQGISITQVLAAQVYLGQGNTAKVKGIIRSQASLKQQTKASEQFKILNEVSQLQIQIISDRLWTEATGSRTPMGKIGSFWDDAEESLDIIDINEIL